MIHSLFLSTFTVQNEDLMKSVRNIALTLSIIFISNISYNQCTESNTNSDSNNTRSDFGQAFTAACDGNLSQFTINHNASSNSVIDVKVFEGDGCGGIEIYNSTIPIPSTAPTTVINFDPIIPVTAGQQYTVFLETDGFGLLLSIDNNDGYIGGDRYSFNCNLEASEDYVFSYTIASAAPIPTLSQWMIIILGLFLTITGIAVMLQKKKLSIVSN